MDSTPKLLLSLAALCLAFGAGTAQLTFSVDQRYVKTYRDTPPECSLPSKPCGNIYDLNEAMASIASNLDLPPPPDSNDGRKPTLPFANDYEVCPYIRHDDTWLSFTWGASGEHTTYLRFLDSFHRVTCLAGMCDTHMYYNGWKFGCVGVWAQRTFNVMWPANNDYVRLVRRERNMNMKCARGYCLVRIRLEYPESCKCAQLQQCSSH